MEGFRDFPGSSVGKTPLFQCRGMGSVPGWGTKIPQATWYSQKKKKKKEGPDREGRRTTPASGDGVSVVGSVAARRRAGCRV